MAVVNADVHVSLNFSRSCKDGGGGCIFRGACRKPRCIRIANL